MFNVTQYGFYVMPYKPYKRHQNNVRRRDIFYVAIDGGLFSFYPTTQNEGSFVIIIRNSRNSRITESDILIIVSQSVDHHH